MRNKYILLCKFRYSGFGDAGINTEAVVTKFKCENFIVNF